MADYVLIEGLLCRTETAMYLEKVDDKVGEYGSGLSLQLFSNKDEDWYVEKDVADALLAAVLAHESKHDAPAIKAQLIVRIVQETNERENDFKTYV